MSTDQGHKTMETKPAEKIRCGEVVHHQSKAIYVTLIYVTSVVVAGETRVLVTLGGYDPRSITHYEQFQVYANDLMVVET